MPELLMYATDIHGDVEFYEFLLAKSAEHKVKYLIIGGDICPNFFVGFDNIMEAQRQFLQAYLIPRLEAFAVETGIRAFIMMGNDDYSINMDLLEKANKKGLLKLAHGHTHEMGKWQVIGYSFINPTPFLFKEWEKKEPAIKKDLDNLLGKNTAKNLILAAHAPPFGTKLDMLYDGSHVGSAGLLEFIRERQPLLTLHGHIHESPTLSKKIKDTIGRTVSLNPGNSKATLIYLDDMEKIKLVV